LEALTAIVPIGLAIAAVVYFDRRTVRSGLLPPAFKTPEGADQPVELAESAGAAGIAKIWTPRRLAAATLLGIVFWLGIFFPLTSIGAPEPDFSSISRAQLFLLHGVFLLTLVGWYTLGYVGGPRSEGSARAGFSRQFGLSSGTIWQDLGIGLAAGVAAWVVVLLVLIGLGVLIWTLGGEDALPQEPPALVPWIAALPIGLRLALSGSAGFVEEIFFRGLLQPRAGIAFSTILFVTAHVGYGQPLMLVGVTLLSLAFAALVRWRQSIWSAVVAHTVFDALQLTVVIPKALEFLQGASAAPV
jgi:membrane protease YdiL (CAAX protease family)